MPKQVDHDQRRREIASAVARIAVEQGLQGVTFREVAAEAGVSVALIQHYFGTKQDLLVRTVNIAADAQGERILQRLGELGPDASPFDRIRTVLVAFLPTDEESRRAMIVYHSYGAAALTDAALRKAEAFRNEAGLRSFFAGELLAAQESGRLASGIEPESEARLLVSIVLGFVGALLGPWVASKLQLPEPFMLSIGGHPFPVL